MASIESYLATVDKVFPIDVDLTPYEKDRVTSKTTTTTPAQAAVKDCK